MATKLFLVWVTLFLSTHAAGGWDDFANNLATDLAPILQLFGEQVTLQYLAESTSVLDCIIFAMAPLGVLTAVVSVPLKYHHAISQQGNFLRNLRSYGVQVNQSAQPKKSAVPTHPPQEGCTSTARIDDTAEDSREVDWQIVPNYQDAEEGDSEWTLRAKDANGIERAQDDIKAAIEQAEAMTHVGFLTLADRSAKV